MRVRLDKEDLVNLVCGIGVSSVSYTSLDALDRSCLSRDDDGRFEWDRDLLSVLGQQALWDLYKKCKEAVKD